MNGGAAKDFEPDDPLDLNVVTYPVESAEEADAALARCLVEEFALAGFTAREVGALFERREYTAAHAILTRRGPDFVRALIHEVFMVAP